MSKCRFDDHIDGYLLDRLGGTERERFEEHYFNCPSCFERLREREALIRAVRARGPALCPAPATERRRPTLGALAPRTLAAAAAVLVLVAAALVVAPRLRKAAPDFVLSGDGTVRGGTIEVVSPRGDLDAPPAALEWRPAGADLEFRVYLFESDVLWTATTRDHSIALPDDVRKRLAAGGEYSWQVKAFSVQGGLAALSERIRFRVLPNR
jgi:hypothetical protein